MYCFLIANIYLPPLKNQLSKVPAGLNSNLTYFWNKVLGIIKRYVGIVKYIRFSSWKYNKL